ncbi:MAG: hypothetical protein U1F34_09290 [Gammaproteobacteria bacterium]
MGFSWHARGHYGWRSSSVAVEATPASQSFFLLVLVIGNPGSAPWRTTDGWYSILSGLVCGVGFLFFYRLLWKVVRRRKL